jgi:hypothetical protein
MRFSTTFVVMALSASAIPARAQSAPLTTPIAVQGSHVSMLTLDTALAVDTAQAATANPIDSVPPFTESVSVVPSLGAPLTGLRAGVHAQESARPLQPTAASTHANLGQARAMMVVGVAGLLAGAIIGGTPGNIIMVGGAVVGLVGLYNYLQ